MHLIYSTILAWLNLVGWLVVSVVLWNNRVTLFAHGDTGTCFCIAVNIWLIVCLLAAALITERWRRLLRCRWNGDYVAQLSVDLKSLDAKPRERREALRTLADHCGEPFGFWPFVWSKNWQFRAVRKLLKRRAAVEAAARLEAEAESLNEVEQTAAPKALPSKDDGPILEPLRRGASETLDRLGEAIKDTMLDWTPDDTDHAEPSEEPLPPLPAEQFVEALRGPFEMVLASLTQAINAAPDARALRDGRERCQALLGSFLDGALELGLQLRIEAALAALPATHPALAGQAWAPWHDAEASLRGPSRSWVEKYRRMKADEF